MTNDELQYTKRLDYKLHLRYEIDLEIEVSAESRDPTWERFGRDLGASGDPFRNHRGPSRNPQGPSRNLQGPPRDPQGTLSKHPSKHPGTFRKPQGPSGNLRNLKEDLGDLPEHATGTKTYIQ